MTITIEHQEDVRFKARAGDHRVTIDLPESHVGGDGGMTPPQLFVSAVGACAGVYTADYCDNQGIDYRGMRITADWEVRERPAASAMSVCASRCPTFRFRPPRSRASGAAWEIACCTTPWLTLAAVRGDSDAGASWPDVLGPKVSAEAAAANPPALIARVRH